MSTAEVLHTSSSPAAWPAGGHVRVAVIGAGFGGLAMAHGLLTHGIEDFVVLDRGHTVGGTWRDNTYPGCGCDVPSHLYSLSFAPNPAWTRSYSRQPEILRYLEGVAARFGIDRHLVLGTEVRSAHWDEATARYLIDTDRGSLTADVLVGAAGPLTEPVVPNLPGLDSFGGTAFHSARWRHDIDLTGQRVAVVGTGASAVQLIPQIQPQVAELTVFQRTPAWVLPRWDRSIGTPERTLFAKLPAAQQLARGAHYAARESSVVGFVVQPAVMRAAEQLARFHLNRQVADPALRGALTPHYRLGCKRVTPSNDYYPALAARNVTLVPSALERFEGNVAIGANGSRHQVDVVIFATGFEVSDMPVAAHIFGREGRSLREAWQAEGRSALRGTTIAGYPNLFLLIGPNVGLGHNSMVYMIESQVRYVLEALGEMTARRVVAMEPQPAAQTRWNERIQRRMRRTVWMTGGCKSWYLDPDGRNTALWPSSTLRFRRQTATINVAEYDLRIGDPELLAARNAASRPSIVAGGAR